MHCLVFSSRERNVCCTTRGEEQEGAKGKEADGDKLSGFVPNTSQAEPSTLSVLWARLFSPHLTDEEGRKVKGIQLLRETVRVCD